MSSFLMVLQGRKPYEEWSVENVCEKADSGLCDIFIIHLFLCYSVDGWGSERTTSCISALR